MELSLGFSPCPNDAFIFDALIHNKIDTEDIKFNVVMADVEELNQKAFKNTLDITKLSFHAFLYNCNQYALLQSGSALGDNCGPILIGTSPLSPPEKSGQALPKEKGDFLIAIPGKYTTANYLLSIAYPHLTNKKEMLFSEIEDAVLNRKVDAGVIIHENRFTYKSKGLVKLMDLGEYWFNLTNMPVPLGGIAINRKHPASLQQRINRLLRNSIDYAFKHPNSGKGFIKAHSQEMDDDVIQKHIRLYVNDYTRDLGIKGRQAVELMFGKAINMGLINKPANNIFASA